MTDSNLALSTKAELGGVRRQEKYGEVAKTGKLLTSDTEELFGPRRPMKHRETFIDLPDDRFGLREGLLEELEEEGRRVVSDFVAKAGPYMTLQEVADKLEKSPEQIRSAVEAGEILALAEPYFSELRFPECQFANGTVLDGIAPVLAVLDVDDASEALLFLKTPAPTQAGRPPIDMLEDGDVDEVIRLATSHGEHGGR